MKDGEGRDIDFKNTVIIMTRNAGTDLIAKLFADPETAPDAAGLAEALRPELAKYFKPAFLGRVTLVPYFPLSDAIIRQIVALQLGRIAPAGARQPTAPRSTGTRRWSRPSRRAARKARSGARNVENILSRTLAAGTFGGGAGAAGGRAGRSATSTLGWSADGSFSYDVDGP